MVLRLVSYTSVIKADRQKWLHISGVRFTGFRQQAGQPKFVLPSHKEKEDSNRLSSALHRHPLPSVLKHNK